MTTAFPVHRSIMATLAANLGLGLLPFLLLASCHPAIPASVALPLGIIPATLMAAAWFLSPQPRRFLKSGMAPARRVPACLLLGASLSAIPWKQHNLPFASAVISTGFALRWLLFGLETRELRNADRRHQPLPCTATRIRRVCTLVTGAIIPLLLLGGLPGLPLLWISFVITLFCQWTVGGEITHTLAARSHSSSAHHEFMTSVHEPDGGIY